MSMNIYVKTVTNKDTCLSLNDLQKCYRKKHVKANKNNDKINDCTFCIDKTSSSNPILECKSKSYCDMNLNDRTKMKVKKDNIDKIVGTITSFILFFTIIFFILDIIYRFDNFIFTFIKSLIGNIVSISFINNFVGHNFTNVIKFNVIFFVLILFLKILYTSLTNDKIKTNETDELIYDDDALEFETVYEDSCKISNNNEEQCVENKQCEYDDGTNLCTYIQCADGKRLSEDHCNDPCQWVRHWRDGHLQDGRCEDGYNRKHDKSLNN